MDGLAQDNATQIEWDSSPTPLQFRATALAPSPFSAIFTFGGKETKITLKNGEDIFKLADACERFLIGLGVEYDVERIDASAEAA